MIANAYQQYQRVQTETATGGQLIILLYGGALRYLTRAELNRDKGDIDGFRADIRRAQDILTELTASLDYEAGGEFAGNLRRLYAYLSRRIGEAEIKNDSAAIPEAQQLLRTLKSAWEGAIAQLGPSHLEPAKAVA